MIDSNIGILGVIPARGGSKSIPRKNLLSLLGKPLIAYTIEEALKSKILTRVILSSDDEEIIAVAKGYGVEVPFKRPAELGTDTALGIDVMKHAISLMERIEGSQYDIVVMLQPTSPLRSANDIDNCVRKLIETRADSVISVVPVGEKHPYRMKMIIDDHLVDFMKEPVENLPKQHLPPLYIRNGAVYASRRDVIMIQGSFKGVDCRPYIMPLQRSVNIDDELDALLVEALMTRGISSSSS